MWTGSVLPRQGRGVWGRDSEGRLGWLGGVGVAGEVLEVSGCGRLVVTVGLVGLNVGLAGPECGTRRRAVGVRAWSASQGRVDQFAAMVEAVRANHRTELDAPHAGQRAMTSEKGHALVASAEFTRRLAGRSHTQQAGRAGTGTSFTIAHEPQAHGDTTRADRPARAGRLRPASVGSAAAEPAAAHRRHPAVAAGHRSRHRPHSGRVKRLAGTGMVTVRPFGVARDRQADSAVGDDAGAQPTIAFPSGVRRV
ncbi:MAG: hypothetical protein JWQ81_4784 [Amycolatopsis sp.]|nr:hypothetical protein [Amycolatopsis sp.]